MKQIIYLFSIMLALMITSSCEQTELGPVENDGVAPGPVSNLSVLNLNGAATVSFDAPTDVDLAYVKAKYTTKDGIVRETTASRYNNTITLEGFADTDPYVITLTAVDRGENESSPVDITANPLEPLYKIAFETLKAQRDFGGVKVNLENAKKTNLAIVVLTHDTLSNFIPTRTYYTDSKDVEFSVRGFEATDRKFGFVVRDRWGNRSDTMSVNVVPLFEERLDRTKMKGFPLPTDATIGWRGSYGGLFDDIISVGSVTNTFYHTGDGNKFPQTLTIDMGVSAQLSRLVYFTRPNQYYDVHAPVDIEVWGSNDPNPDGSYDDSWTLMTKYKNIKPSGLPVGQMTQADVALGEEGFTITIPLDAPKVRYLRYKVFRSWTNSAYVHIYELRVFGDTQ